MIWHICCALVFESLEMRLFYLIMVLNRIKGTYFLLGVHTEEIVMLP